MYLNVLIDTILIIAFVFFAVLALKEAYASNRQRILAWSVLGIFGVAVILYSTPISLFAGTFIYLICEYIYLFRKGSKVRKEFENNLKYSEEKFKSLVNSLNDRVFTLDKQLKYSGVYGNWFEINSIDKEGFEGKAIREVFPPETALIHERAGLKALLGETVIYNWTAGDEMENDMRYFENTLSPLKSAEGNIIGVVGVTRDVTNNKKVENELIALNYKLKDLSFIDPLTNIANRRYFDQYIKNEWNRSIRNKDYISILMIDIDNFKLLNDTYGHMQGDACLKAVANTLKKTFKRPGDLVARYGGEEFIAVLPHTDEKGALEVAGRLLTNMENLKIKNLESDEYFSVTVSIGLASASPLGTDMADNLIKGADKALYRAKKKGRNRVEISAGRVPPSK